MKEKGALDVSASFILGLLGFILAIVAVFAFLMLYTEKTSDLTESMYERVKRSICNIFSFGPIQLCSLFLGFAKKKQKRKSKGFEWSVVMTIILFAVIALLLIAFFWINWPRVLEYAESTLNSLG